MSRARKKRAKSTIGGMKASIKYDRQSKTVVLTIKGISHQQAQALYMFMSMMHHPAVKNTARLDYEKRIIDLKIVKSNMLIELSVNPAHNAQFQIDMGQSIDSVLGNE
jgi:hypothetical protein